MISYFSRKGKLNTCEDSLTSVVFDGLKYLPTELFWRILKNSLYQDKLPYASGEMENISFWEHWGAEGTENKNFVEPDVFIRFQEFDIIIEAKRYDENQQTKDQLTKEITAYYNQYGESEANELEKKNKPKKKLYFIQLGGLRDKEGEEDYINGNNCACICKTDWSRILEQLATENNKLKSYPYSIQNAHSRIIKDIIAGLEFHQYYKLSWLYDMDVPYIDYCSPLNLFDYAKQ